MKYSIYAYQTALTLLLIIGLVFVFPIYLFAQSNVAQSNIVTVEIVKFKFTPQNIEIKPGTTVRWVNKEKRQYHSVWFEKSGEPEPDYFFPDESYEKTFDKNGSFSYRCGPHPEMTGLVNVTN